MTDVLHIDVETVAVADLKRTGAWRYAEHPDTDCIVACYRFGANGPVKTWLPGSPCPVEIQMHVEDGGRIAAWNAMFERAIWLQVLTPKHGWPLPLAEQFAQWRKLPTGGYRCLWIWRLMLSGHRRKTKRGID